MKIIDAHLHLSRIALFSWTAQELSQVDYTVDGLLKEMEDCQIIAAVGMGLQESTAGAFPDANAPNPMVLDLGSIPERIKYCAGINPISLAAENRQAQLERIAAELDKPQVAGIKLYPGYYHLYITDPIYEPIYQLASEYDLPIVVHCGDTYSERGILKYSHPLTVNEMAVMYPHIKFVIAHYGNPWVLDTGVTITNNPNVYTDLSGLLLGGSQQAKEFSNEPLLMNYIKTGILYSQHYDKMLFGSDWPLVELSSYISVIKQLIPEEYWEMVFYSNALTVFHRLAPSIKEAETRK